MITATRTSMPASEVGSAVTRIDSADLKRRQVDTLSGALGFVPGAPAAGYGAPGASSSIFLRGANSNQTLFLVDGIRLNDPNTDYGNFLGGSRLASGDTVEVLRGPQSTLYGAEAMGGVISLATAKGSGPDSGGISVEAGSFGTVQGTTSAQGEHGPWAYNFSLTGGQTQNDRPNNDFENISGVFRLDRTLSETVSIGTTWRVFRGAYQSPGDVYTNDPNNEERETNALGTVFIEFNPTPAWSGRITLAGQEREFVSESPAPNPPWGTPAEKYVVTNRRGVLDAQVSWSGLEDHRLTVGTTEEINHTRNTGYGEINERETTWAVFAQDEWNPLENVYLTGGLRHDDYESFGGHTTGRVTAAWEALPKQLKARASYGTAFRAPGFLDLYGVSTLYGGYRGNPDLKPEKAKGWDAGVDYYLPRQWGTLGATWFQTDYKNLIISDSQPGVPSTMTNADHARTRGLELSANLNLPADIKLTVAYTYLEAEKSTQLRTTRLQRRPKHSLAADIWRSFGEFDLGAGAQWIDGRKDVNAQTYATIDGDSYVTARLYGAWHATKNITVRARVENLFDEKYNVVDGYPGLPFGAYGSVEWRF